MIRILQWGTRRSIVKIYNKDTNGDYDSVQIHIIDNNYLINLIEHPNITTITR